MNFSRVSVDFCVPPGKVGPVNQRKAEVSASSPGPTLMCNKREREKNDLNLNYLNPSF